MGKSSATIIIAPAENYPPNQPVEYVDILSHCHNLKILDCSIDLGHDASDFAGSYQQDIMGTLPFPKFNEQLAREVVAEMFKIFFINDPAAQLAALSVTFERYLECDRGQGETIRFPIRIRKRDCIEESFFHDGVYFEDSGKWVKRTWNQTEEPVPFHSEAQKMDWLYYVY